MDEQATAAPAPATLQTLRVAALPDETLAALTLGMLRECYLRLQESDFENAEMRRVAEVVTEPVRRLRSGHVTLELVPEVLAFDVNTGRQIDPSVVPAELTTTRTFATLDLDELSHGQVLSFRAPCGVFVVRQTDPARVEIPAEVVAGLGSQIANGIGAALEKLPKPEVTVNNTVEPAPVTVLESDQGALDFTFERDGAGRIVKAHAE